MTAMPAAVISGEDEDVACNLCSQRNADFHCRLQRSQLVTCRDCGLTYVNPRRPAAFLDARLQSWAVEDAVDPERLAIAFEPATMAHYARFVRRLTRATNGPGNLLDVGCATGAFLVAARAQGWRVEGIEVGRASAAYASETLGLAVTAGSLYSFDPGNDRFDAIVFLEVVEHLTDPLGALKRLHGWLRPGGVLLLSTPNFDSLFRRLHGPRWWVINCEDEHIVLFNRHTIRHALERAGFEPLQSGSRSIDYAGLLGQYRRPAPANPATGAGYYEARARKTRLKHLLARCGLLAAARAILRIQDHFLSSRWSPVRGLGEQLVVLARKPRDA